MNRISSPALTLPRLAVLASVLAAFALLCAAPYILPRVSAAEVQASAASGADFGPSSNAGALPHRHSGVNAKIPKPPAGKRKSLPARRVVPAADLSAASD